MKCKTESNIYWECPNKYCGYRVTDIEYMLIKFNPNCRCGYSSWMNFIRNVISDAQPRKNNLN
jgi:hypothetical protein